MSFDVSAISNDYFYLLHSNSLSVITCRKVTSFSKDPTFFFSFFFFRKSKRDSSTSIIRSPQRNWEVNDIFRKISSTFHVSNACSVTFVRKRLDLIRSGTIGLKKSVYVCVCVRVRPYIYIIYITEVQICLSLKYFTTYLLF